MAAMKLRIFSWNFDNGALNAKKQDFLNEVMRSQLRPDICILLEYNNPTTGHADPFIKEFMANEGYDLAQIAWLSEAPSVSKTKRQGAVFVSRRSLISVQPATPVPMPFQGYKTFEVSRIGTDKRPFFILAPVLLHHDEALARLCVLLEDLRKRALPCLAIGDFNREFTNWAKSHETKAGISWLCQPPPKFVDAKGSKASTVLPKYLSYATKFGGGTSSYSKRYDYAICTPGKSLAINRVWHYADRPWTDHMPIAIEIGVSI